MGAIVSKLCSGPSNPILSLNDTCQRLRCLMACCGGNVNVVTRGDATDAGVQTEEPYGETIAKEEEEEEEEEDKGVASPSDETEV